MTRSELLAFIRSHRYAVQSSVSESARAQSAVVGIAVSDAFEIVFDTVDSSRKWQNLRRNPAIAFVVGGTSDGDERTLQYEGVADLPDGGELDAVRELYFSRFPEGRARLSWPGCIHIRVRPSWMRYSNYNVNPPEILEWDAAALRNLA